MHSTDSRKEFGPQERILYIKFGKNALQAFDLYLLHSASTGANEAREKERVNNFTKFHKLIWTRIFHRN